ncbi:DUF5916 domain-containing protein [Glaciecola sp. MF2-115]|uniref:carbohydrate binding family 9 domain-containing protein n=1 Tax=Glaciecola sp. MF2-115 TaxID=3384827 RepID=UPI00399F304C
MLKLRTGRLSFSAALLFVFITLISSANAQDIQNPPQLLKSKFDTISIPFHNEKPTIDGVLDEAVWQKAGKAHLNYVVRPFENTIPPVNTDVFYYEDGANLYVAYIAHDFKPDDIRVFLRDRDDTWGQDMVGVKIDTYGDGRLAYQYFVNPLGVQTDSIENEMTGNESASWNGIWLSEGRITDKGYVVEFAIPLRLMNFEESEEEKHWGIEFVRFYPRADELRISHLPTDRDNACNLCQMGGARGFKNARQGESLAIVPTAVLGAARTRDPEQSNDWDYQNNQEVGLNVNWSITPEISLQGTLNPDFSQVEADVAQLSINNTFALFFGERRPFFVKNADYFSSFQNLIYTRNINAPDYGLKITGRKDKHSLGLFVANDEQTTFLVPGNLGSSVASFEEASLNLGGRYRFDYSDDLAIGTVLTLREADHYHNYLSSIDLKYRLSDQDTISAQIIATETEYPDELYKGFCDEECLNPSDYNESTLRTNKEGSFTGLSYILDYRKETSNYYIRARHQYADEGYRADLGFQSQVDRRVSVIGGGYNWWNENSWWNNINIDGDWDISHNGEGELIEKELEGRIRISGDYQTRFEVGARKRDRVGLRIDPSILAIDGNSNLFQEYSYKMFFRTSPNQHLNFGVFQRVGDEVDFVNNRLGEQVYIEPFINLNLGRHIKLNMQHTYSKLDSNDKPLFNANLTDIRMTYQFDQKQFFRVTLAYSDISRNQDNYDFDVDEDSKNVGFQLLYSYKLNPLTKFFVGYADSAYDNDSLNKLKTNQQSVFMKFSYAWLR